MLFVAFAVPEGTPRSADPRQQISFVPQRTDFQPHRKQESG